MKTKILSTSGKETKDINLPKVFSSKIREDLAQRYFEISKRIQPYSSYKYAGMEYSASGILSHRRHKWKTTYGKGISRVPRKIFWRRGTQFYWQGATVASTVGGRKAHSPKAERFLKNKKVNKKEQLAAISAAISATADNNYVSKRYLRIDEVKNLPYVVEGKVTELNTKQFLELLKKILGDNYEVALKEKNKRAGRGKSRGRKHKTSAGLLFIVGKDETFKNKRVEVRRVNELGMEDLYPLGRLVVYTEKAIAELEKLWEKEK